MDIIKNLIINQLGEKETDIVEYKKIRLNEKLEVFFNYEDNYMNNQKYIYESKIPISFYECYKIRTYMNKLLENIYYIGNCNNMWYEIEELENEIKQQEPLYTNDLIKKDKPIYRKSFGLSIIYFCVFMGLYQISLFNWYCISKLTNEGLYDLRDIPIYLGLRTAIVLIIVSTYILFYYIGIFKILYSILYFIINYILYYTVILLIELIIIIIITLIWVLKLLFIILIVLPRLLFFLIYFIFKLLLGIITLFGKFSSIEDMRLGMNEIKKEALNDAHNTIGTSDLDIFDNIFNIETIRIGLGSISLNTGFKALTYSIKLLINSLLNNLLIVGDSGAELLEDNLVSKLAGCDRNIVLEKMININNEEKKEKKNLKQCFTN